MLPYVVTISDYDAPHQRASTATRHVRTMSLAKAWRVATRAQRRGLRLHAARALRTASPSAMAAECLNLARVVREGGDKVFAAVWVARAAEWRLHFAREMQANEEFAGLNPALMAPKARLDRSNWGVSGGMAGGAYRSAVIAMRAL